MRSVNKTSIDDLDNIWTDIWKNQDLIEAIKNINKDENMRWKLKYAPMKGKFLEAGCGVGQYVLYLKKIGFDVEGIDISKKTVIQANENARNLGFDSDLFQIGDVRKLPYENNSISYYLSMGVIEHFAEGPDAALKEAYRVLRPGGIAYIATPTKYSWAHANSMIKWIFIIHKLPRNIVKYVLRKLGILKIKKTGWVENLWTLKELKTFVKSKGFIITDGANTGIKSSFEINCRSEKKIWHRILTKSRRFIYPIIDRYEDSELAKFGINNIVIAVKPGKKMYCFYCNTKYSFGELNLGKYSVPLCNQCIAKLPNKVCERYKFGEKPLFDKRIYHKNKSNSRVCNCESCGNRYKNEIIFGDYGFSKSYCEECIAIPENSIKIRNLNLKYENHN